MVDVDTSDARVRAAYAAAEARAPREQVATTLRRARARATCALSTDDDWLRELGRVAA